MNETKDLFKIEIEEAKKKLPKEALAAIDAIDWKSAIIALRDKKGYTFEQIEDIELETELLLAGLVTPANFPKELESRMKLSSAKVDELVNELNDSVFSKIRNELIKITAQGGVVEKPVEERKNEPASNALRSDAGREIFKSAGIEVNPTEPQPMPSIVKERGNEGAMETREDMLAKVEKPELITSEAELKRVLPASVFSKLSGSFNLPSVKTEYSLQNMSKTTLPTEKIPTPVPTIKTPSAIVPNAVKIDPYREATE